ncbi:MAG: hypothetical protein M1833_005124 [Piccolia ochrophora]|nr:MAG: hypothetical protein M1833_005124 [Piccolia ochrophora]
MTNQQNGQDDPLAAARAAERELNSHEAKVGHGVSDSANESGVDAAAVNRFPGASVTVGPAASGREIPPEQGGDVRRDTGQPTKDRDFEGEGGPETKAKIAEEERGGDDSVRGNVRQGGGQTGKYT